MELPVDEVEDIRNADRRPPASTRVSARTGTALGDLIPNDAPLSRRRLTDEADTTLRERSRLPEAERNVARLRLIGEREPVALRETPPSQARASARSSRTGHQAARPRRGAGRPPRSGRPPSSGARSPRPGPPTSLHAAAPVIGAAAVGTRTIEQQPLDPVEGVGLRDADARRPPPAARPPGHQAAVREQLGVEAVAGRVERRPGDRLGGRVLALRLGPQPAEPLDERGDRQHVVQPTGCRAPTSTVPRRCSRTSTDSVVAHRRPRGRREARLVVGPFSFRGCSRAGRACTIAAGGRHSSLPEPPGEFAVRAWSTGSHSRRPLNARTAASTPGIPTCTCRAHSGVA